MLRIPLISFKEIIKFLYQQILTINKLYTQVLNGDLASDDKLFYHLRERFQLFLQHRIKNRQDIEDIVQETLTAIARKYKTEKIENFSAWAYKILENHLLYYYRQKKNKTAREEILDSSNDQHCTNPDYQLQINLMDCLKKLNRESPRYAEILKLFYEGFNTDEICERLDINRNTMYILLSRARNMLRTCLDNKKVR